MVDLLQRVLYSVNNGSSVCSKMCNVPKCKLNLELLRDFLALNYM